MERLWDEAFDAPPDRALGSLSLSLSLPFSLSLSQSQSQSQ